MRIKLFQHASDGGLGYLPLVNRIHISGFDVGKYLFNLLITANGLLLPAKGVSTDHLSAYYHPEGDNNGKKKGVNEIIRPSHKMLILYCIPEADLSH